MPFGIASASAIFLRMIKSVLRGIPCVLVRAADILVSRQMDEEHIANVDQVLTRLGKAGLRARAKKCHFMESEVTYMGYIFYAQGH